MNKGKTFFINFGKVFLAWLWICCDVGAYSSSSSIFSGDNSPWAWDPSSDNPVANPDAIVISNNVRFTVLTSRLLRIEDCTSNSLVCEDRKTIAVINRNLPVPKYTSEVNNKTLTISTEHLTLTYEIGSQLSPNTLQVTGKFQYNDDDKDDESFWTYKYGTVDPLNLLGTIRTLDFQEVVSLNCSDHTPDAHCEPGLISRSGYAIINDTLNWALDDENSWWAEPNVDKEDIYILGHGLDFKAALKDYIKIGGRIPLLPKYSFGVWFSRWYDYTPGNVVEIVKKYEQHSLPLDVVVLDMNWHTKDRWTGYSWDDHLFSQHSDAISYMKHRQLAVTMNLHDAEGVHSHETHYPEMCRAIAKLQDTNETINFSIVNSTIAYALEDTILWPLEKNGVDFWWIDWQQGEGEKGEGGAAGNKQNPTIWLEHIRSTNAQRRYQSNRNMVLARFGGLGAHRYPIHFSGDAAQSWQELSFQPYFSMTATNVGAIWSHDTSGTNPELFTRWLQWSVVSHISRTHDRGESAGRCAKVDPETCVMVEPWKTENAEANGKALRLRGALNPYLYSSARRTYETGVGYVTPLYYEWPTLEEAYETAAPHPSKNSSAFASQYLFGDDMMVAPVVTPSNKTTGLTELRVWIPPGIWIGLLDGRVVSGASDGSSSLSLQVDLEDIPIFVKAGSIIPTLPVLPGETIGLARKEYTHLIWTVYLATGAPTSGVGTVYEDDGVSTAYLRGKSAITTAMYKIEKSRTAHSLLRGDDDETATTTNTLTFTVATEGTYDTIPSFRSTTLRLTNTRPPQKVYSSGIEIPYSRFGGSGTWKYDMADAAVVIELTPSKIVDGVVVKLEMSTSPTTSSLALLDGLGYRLRRANSAKATLDEIRMTPGSQTGESSLNAYLMRAASSVSNLEFLAGNRNRNRNNNNNNNLESSFEKMIQLLDDEILSGAIQEVKDVYNSLKPLLSRVVDEERHLDTTGFDNSIEDPHFPTLMDSNPKVIHRLERAITLLNDVV
jgi:alpha-glucosidase (family GH31 glycosyl hydrolase)